MTGSNTIWKSKRQYCIGKSNGLITSESFGYPDVSSDIPPILHNVTIKDDEFTLKVLKQRKPLQYQQEC